MPDLQAKAGQPAIVGFALYGADEYTALPGEAANVIVELSRTNAANDGVEAANDVAVTITESQSFPGNYYAIFEVPAGHVGRTYYLVVRHDESFADHQFTIQVVAAAGANEGYIVSVSGHPWGINQPVVVTWTILGKINLQPVVPETLISADLIDIDAVTILQTIDGPDLAVGGVGIYTGSFNAVPALGTYYARLTFLGAAGEPNTVWIDRVVVENLGAVVVNGIISLDDFKDGYLGRFPGQPDAAQLLRGDGGEQLVSDAAIERAIIDQAALVGRRLSTTLGLTRYAARPGVTRGGGTALVKGVDYDEEADPLDFDHLHAGTAHGQLTLPHTHVKRITRARVIYGETVLWELPTRWFSLRHRQGTAFVIVDSVDADATGEGVTFSAIFAIVNAWVATGFPRVPLVWAVDYEAGLTDLLEKYADVRATIIWRAVATVLGLAAVAANKQAVQSQSTGKDGLSRSLSVGDSQPGGRYYRLLESPIIKDWLTDEHLARLRKLVRPGIRIYV